MAEYFASGDWHVTKGKEKEFVAAWTEFLQWTRKSQPGLARATLSRDANDANHFLSVSEWENKSAIETWRTSPDFQKLFLAAKNLCDEHSNSNYELASSV